MTEQRFRTLGMQNRLRNSILVREDIICVRNEREFAVLQRYPNAEGLTGITFSIPLTMQDADIINKSKIAQVEHFTESGTLVFTRKSFFENTLMIDLITDILIKHERQQQRIPHMA